MSVPINAFVSGTFTSDGTIKNLSLPSGYNRLDLYDISDFSDASSTSVFTATGTSSMPADAAIYAIGNGGSSVLAPKYTATGGFTFISDSANQALGAATFLTASASAINRANPAVALTGTTTGLVASSTVVRLYNTVGMEQIAGMDFTVGTIVGATSFQLKYLNNSGFAANCVASGADAFFRIVPSDPRYYPRRRFITAISSSGTSSIITMSVTHGFVAGEAIRVIVPSAFGMTQMNGLIGNITAVSTANNTITVDIDSSAFTAFAFPTSATAAAGVTFAQVAPVGETANGTYANSLNDATVNQSFSGVQIGTTVQTSGKTYQYIAQRGISV